RAGARGAPRPNRPARRQRADGDAIRTLSLAAPPRPPPAPPGRDSSAWRWWRWLGPPCVATASCRPSGRAVVSNVARRRTKPDNWPLRCARRPKGPREALHLPGRSRRSHDLRRPPRVLHRQTGASVLASTPETLVATRGHPRDRRAGPPLGHGHAGPRRPRLGQLRV